MASSWDYADIVRMNPPGPGQAVAPLAHLLRIGAINSVLLCEASRLLEGDQSEPSVICFAQLPFPLLDCSRKQQADGAYAGAHFEVWLRPARIVVDEKGALTLLEREDDLRGSGQPTSGGTGSGGMDITQIVAMARLWGIRSKFHPRYLDAMTEDGLLDRIIVQPHENWERRVENGFLRSAATMNASQFEVNLSRRLRPEMHAALERLLTSVERERLASLGGENTLCAYFLMPAPGRVCFHAPPVPTLQLLRSEMLIGEGLTLYFDTRLTPFDRFLVDGVIFAVLGRDTDCRVVEFEERGEMALVRLKARRRQDLEAVAEAFYRSVWAEQEKAQTQILMRLSSALQSHAIREGLSELRTHLERMTLTPEAKDYLEDQGRQHAVRAAAARPAWSWTLKDDHVRLPRPCKLFISYSRKDNDLRAELESHLSLLKRQGIVETWTDRALAPGQEWDSTIQAALREADIVLMLVSADFFASGYITEVELQMAMDRHGEGETVVVPILVRPTDWESSPLARLQALPANAEAITMWANRDEAWVDVVHGIRRMVMAKAGELRRSSTALMLP